jgi:hypothetical protein
MSAKTQDSAKANARTTRTPPAAPRTPVVEPEADQCADGHDEEYRGEVAGQIGDGAAGQHRGSSDG